MILAFSTEGLEVLIGSAGMWIQVYQGEQYIRWDVLQYPKDFVKAAEAGLSGSGMEPFEFSISQPTLSGSFTNVRFGEVASVITGRPWSPGVPHRKLEPISCSPNFKVLGPGGLGELTEMIKDFWSPKGYCVFSRVTKSDWLRVWANCRGELIFELRYAVGSVLWVVRGIPESLLKAGLRVHRFQGEISLGFDLPGSVLTGEFSKTDARDPIRMMLRDLRLPLDYHREDCQGAFCLSILPDEFERLLDAIYNFWTI